MIMDFIAGFLLLALDPTILMGLLFSLPVLSAFRMSRSAGIMMIVISIFLYLCGVIILSNSLKADDTVASLIFLPIALGIFYLVFLTGNLYTNLVGQEERSLALISLIQVGQELGISSSLQKVLTMGLNVVKTLFPAHSCVIYMKGSGDDAIVRVKAYSSKTPECFVDFNPDITPSLVGKAMKEKTDILVGNFSSDPMEDVIPKDKGFRSMMISPLAFEDKTVGALMVMHTIHDYYTKEDLKLFNMLAIQIALAIRNIQIQETMGTMAITDSLSGLYTHGYFQENLSDVLTKAKYDNKPVSIMIIDVDFFKKINDSYGHPQGDALLKQLGGVLRSVARKEDTLCRYGGDEFTVTMQNTNRISAVILAEKIRTAVEEYEFVLKGQIVHITISGGVGSFPEDSQTKKELIEVADKALYQSKQAGRNKISFGAAKK
jgi:diguanylate cyclase (GGDEF)-like protein